MKSLQKQLWTWLLVVVACLLPRIAVAQAQDVYDFGTIVNDGNSPSALTLSGTTLYGTCNSGGTNSKGTIFKINTDHTGYKVLYNFGTGTTDGINPTAALTLVGSTLYGTTNAGGSNGKGTIFQINTDGLGYEPLYSFGTGDSDGTTPSAALTLVGSSLYGTTSAGGSNGAGTIFQISTAGSGYQVLYSFGTGANDGIGPYAALTLAGTTLYGTTNSGGTVGNGTIYEFNTADSTYKSLQSFMVSEYALNQAYALTLVGSTLYGTTNTDLGDSSYVGTIYQINTDGSGYQVLYTSGSYANDANPPCASLTLVGSTLYGVTYGIYGATDDGGNAPGTIFHFNPASTPVQVDYDVNFDSDTDSSDTFGPSASLTLVNGSALYGVSFLGGRYENGNIFEFNLPTTSVIKVTASPLAGGTAGTSGTYANGSTAMVTAIPASGYLFNNWTLLGAQVSTSSNYSFTVAGNQALVANFVPGPFVTVTATAGSNGDIGPSGSVAVVTGESVTFTATPSSGYLVNQWLLDNSVVQTGGGAYTLNNVTTSHTVQVTFVVPTATGTTSDGFAYAVANGEATITGYTGSGGAIAIPSTINTWSVTAIGHGAFSGVTNPTSISIPSSVTSIGTAPFGDCLSLTSITVDPANPAYIGVDGVLFNQGQTTLIQYPVSKVTTSYTIPNSVTTIGSSAFGGSAFLTSVTIPNGVTTIGDSAFFAVPLTSVTIPNSVTSIGQYAFEEDVNMTTATIGSGIPSAGYGSFAFSACANLTTVNFYGYPPTDTSVFQVDTKANYFYFVSDSTLSALTLSGVTLTPAFSGATSNYTASVPYATTSTTVAATATGSFGGATVSGNLGSQSLSVGANPFSIQVIAVDGTPEIYTVTVTRDPLTSYTVTPSAGTGGSISPNTVQTVAGGSNVSFTASPAVYYGVNQWLVNGALAQSGGTAFTLNNVTANDTVEVTFVRLSSVDTLSSLKVSAGILTPAFSPSIHAYTVTVPSTTTSETVTPTVTAGSDATVTVNGNSVLSGSADGPITQSAGVNPAIQVVVTAQDGVTTGTYAITVTVLRAPTAVTESYTNLTATSVTLNGTVNANGTSTTTSFSYGLTTGYGSTVAATPAAVTGGTTTAVSAKLTGLKPATQYFYLTQGVSAGGTSTPDTGGTFTTPNNVATISGLVLSSGPLSPSFLSTGTSYTATVPYTTTSVTLTPTVTAGSNGAVTVDGVGVPSGSASGPISLNAGSNSIPIVVTAQDGTTKRTYNVTVTRTAASTNANLAGLVLNPAGTLSPAFAPTTTSYTIAETSTTSSVTLTPTTADPAATVTVDTAAVISGNASSSIALSSGTTPITVMVTAQDGKTKKTYTVTVLHPSTAVTGSDSNLTATSVTLHGTVNANSTSTTTSFSYGLTNSYGSTVAATPSPVTGSTPTSVSATITGLKPATQYFYLAKGVSTGGTSPPDSGGTFTTPNNVATLSGLVPSSGSLTPAIFSSTTTAYTATVAYTTTSVTLTPTVTTGSNATVTVNGASVNSGSASGPISLKVGSSVIPVVVTAQDGTTKKTYNVTVTRTAASTNANLSSLVLNPAGILSPAFAPATTSYTAPVTSTTSSVTLTPTTTDPTATVTVDTAAVTSGSASGAIALSPGTTPITVVVTAQDGKTTKTYTVTVLHPPTAVTGSSTALTATGVTLNGTVNANGMSTTTSFSYGLTTGYGSTAATTPATVTGGTTTAVSAKLTGLKPATQYFYLAKGISAGGTSPPDSGGTFTTPSNVATLSGLVASSGTLSPAFSSATIAYTESVGNSTPSLTLTPTVTNTNATVTVNGSAVISGTASLAISLNVGSNPIHVVVTAQDGTTTKTYTVTVTRTSTGQLKGQLAAKAVDPSNTTATTTARADGPPAAAVPTPATTTPVPIKAQLTGPMENGAVLSGASAAFTWNTGRGVSEYWLSVGSAVGGTDLYDGSQGVSLSHTVTLPTDGEDVYVTLHSMINGSWLVNNYVFTTANTTARAALTGPVANGGLLPGAAVPFTWNAGSGVSAYWLSVGSAAGGTDLYDGNQGLALSRTVTMPTDGEDVYVTLRSMINGLWLANSYAFSAADTTKAVLTNPANQSVLPGAVTVFTWDSVPGAVAYWLSVGSTAGGTDLYEASEGAALSQSVTVPTDGRQLFVTLKTSINGQWLASSSTLTASGGVTTPAAQTTPPVPSASDGGASPTASTSPASGSSAPVAAELTSPADHLVLTGSPVTFTWNAGAGVSEYWLSVGSSTVATDLYSASQGSNNKVTIAVPTDGSPLYVTLSSLIDGQWQSNQYLYQAALPP